MKRLTRGSAHQLYGCLEWIWFIHNNMIYVYVIVPEITKMYNMNEVDQDLGGPLCIWCCRCFARGATNTPLPQPPVVEKKQSGSGKANQFCCWLITFISKQSHLGIDMCAHHFWLYKQRCKTFERRVDETIDDGHLCTRSFPWAQTKCGESLCETVFRDRPQREHWHWPTGHAPLMGRFWNQTSILTIHDLMCCRSVYLQCICMARWRNNTLPIKGALIIQLVNVDRIKHGFTLQNRRRNAYRAMQKHNNSQVLIKVAFSCNTQSGQKNKPLSKNATIIQHAWNFCAIRTSRALPWNQRFHSVWHFIETVSIFSIFHHLGTACLSLCSEQSTLAFVSVLTAKSCIHITELHCSHDRSCDLETLYGVWGFFRKNLKRSQMQCWQCVS